MDDPRNRKGPATANTSRHARSDLVRDPATRERVRTDHGIAQMMAIAGEGVAHPPPGTYAKQLARAKAELARLQRRRRRLTALGVICVITLFIVLQTPIHRKAPVALGVTEAFAMAGTTYAILQVARVKRELEDARQEIFTLEFLYEALESDELIRELT